MKKFVITGGAGFIGSHLVRYLLKAESGAKIIVIDNLSTGSIDNLFSIMGKIEFENIDITEYNRLGQLLYNADCVFHLAAIPSVTESIQKSILTNKVNLSGSLNILEAARKNNVKKVILSSSCAVYGNAERKKIDEETPPYPLSPYALQKKASEDYFRIYNEIHGLNALALRYFNVFGERQDPHSDYAAVIPKFIKLAKEGEKLRIFGDGKQTRDFIYAGEIARANYLAYKSDEKKGVFNIGSGNSISINSLANMIVDIAGSKSEIVHEPERKGEVRNSCSDSSLAEKKIGFKVNISLEDAIKKLILG